MKSKNSKLSLRKKMVIQKISPCILAIFLGIDNMLKYDNRIVGFIAATVAILFLVVFVYSNGKESEPEDEMAKQNILKAGSLSFVITMLSVGLIMCFGLFMGMSTIVISLPTIFFIFAGMNVLNVIIFLIYDIRGNKIWQR